MTALLTLILVLAAQAPPPTPTLASVSAALRSAPAWQSRFEQRYVPAGFDVGTTDSGTVLASAPGQVRFDYAGDDPRVFAFDGAVARMVDARAGTCDAVRLDDRKVGSLPLAVLLDPERAAGAFETTSVEGALRLVPREANPDVKEIRLWAGPDGLPNQLVIVDGSDNHNQFTFAGWTRATAPELAAFRPALPSQPPCPPHD